jgi:restriction endonuclease S subunit
LLKLNPSNALEADIAREYVSNLDNDLILKHKELNVIKEILKSGAKYPMIPLKEFIVSIAEDRRIIIDDNLIYKDPTISTKTNRISVRNEEEGRFLKVKKRIKIERGDFVIGLLHTQNGAFAFSEEEFASTGTFIPFKIDENQISKKYLFNLMRSVLRQLIKEDTTGRENYKIDDILELIVPLPSLDEQAAFVAQIEKQKAIIEGAVKVLNNWKMLESDFVKESVNYNNLIIDDFASVGTGSTPSREIEDYFIGENNWVLTSEVEMNEIFETTEKLSDKAIQDYGLRTYPINTILIAMYGQGKTRGQSALLQIPASITQNCGAIVVDEEKAVPKYVWYYLMSIYDKIRGQDYSGGGVPHLNLSIVKQIRVPLPDITIQEKIVIELNSQMQILEGLRKIKANAEIKIGKILADVWGVEFVEPIKVEVEDEQEN